MPDHTDTLQPPLLEVQGLKKDFPVKRGLFGGPRKYVHAVDDLSFTLSPGETIGVVGESGCGKSTAARMIVRLVEPTAGRVLLNGVDITALPPAKMREFRRSIQFIFQDPYSSLNPRLRAGDIVSEPLVNFGIARGSELTERVEWLFDRVGLRRELIDRLPHEFSGGQRQRLGIARALAVNPKVIVADEAVSALDVSVQAQVINLLRDLQDEFGIAYIFIAHDLAVVQHISHRVAVMYLGQMVEFGARDAVFRSPQHPYTEALMNSVPIPDPEVTTTDVVLSGEVPSPMNPPPGCRFHTRCPLAIDKCRSVQPPIKEVAPGHRVACHLR
ncbi:dipeptide ABC transporter ATP-binding protein [Thalassobaculum sp.]|uniref:ABC transporter ATP-binding protein n=1 Tax=Thalassobaculum sp. TaxID=2022740 RepID=UPI0032EBCF21